MDHRMRVRELAEPVLRADLPCARGGDEPLGSGGAHQLKRLVRDVRRIKQHPEHDVSVDEDPGAQLQRSSSSSGQGSKDGSGTGPATNPTGRGGGAWTGTRWATGVPSRAMTTSTPAST